MPDAPSAAIDAADALFAPDAPHGISLALVVQHRGEIVLERYGSQPDTVFGPGGAVDEDTTLVSWSMAKSITHALIGMAVGDGLVSLDGPAAVPSWRGTDKEAISLQDLLDMRPGLHFVEDYVDDSVSNCLEMLFGPGADDMAAYAAALPVDHAPGTHWNYSSGTTNIVARILGDALGDVTPGDHRHIEAFLRDRLFGPLGMTSAIPKFDGHGTFVGSSYVYATARDFVRFGNLYLRDGLIDGRRILPEGWCEHARTFVADDPDGDFAYGRHWWLWPDHPGVFACHGFEGQYTIVDPGRDLVIVHLGKSPAAQRAPLTAELRRVLDSFV